MNCGCLFLVESIWARLCCRESLFISSRNAVAIFGICLPQSLPMRMYQTWRQASRQECSRLHSNTNDRRPLARRCSESIAVTRVRFKAIGDNGVAYADLILCTPRLIAKGFGEQLHLIGNRILNGSPSKRESPCPVCVRSAEIQVDFEITARIP